MSADTPRSSLEETLRPHWDGSEDHVSAICSRDLWVETGVALV